MIDECRVWYGIFSEVYQDELTDWASAGQAFDAPEHIRCDEFDLSDEELFHSTFSAPSLFGARTVILRDCQEWNAPVVKQALTLMEESEGDFRVSLLYQGREVTKTIEPFVTEYIDRRIQFQEPQDMADWLVTYLGENDLRISGDDAYAVAEHVGRTVDSVQVLVRVALAVIANHPTETVTYQDMRVFLGQLGEVAMFSLTDAIASGDRSYAREVVERLSGSYQPLALLGFLKNRYRSYMVLYGDDSDEALETMGIKRGAARYVRGEARTLGMRRLIRSFSEINQSDSDMKGGLELSPQLQISMLVDTLTNHFRNALRKAS